MSKAANFELGVYLDSYRGLVSAVRIISIASIARFQSQYQPHERICCALLAVQCSLFFLCLALFVVRYFRT